jgi:DNA-binding MarR family transcriptional regulator
VFARSSTVARPASNRASISAPARALGWKRFAILTSLTEHGSASQADLGRRLWIDRSDLHALLNELERILQGGG